jgi:hypothetical protein
MMRGISQREFARRDGCDPKLVRRGLGQGKLIAFDDGSIDPELVGSPWRKGNFREKPGKPGKTRQRRQNPPKTDEQPPAGQNAYETYGEAQRRKESYLASLRQLEFEVKSGRLVDAATVRNQVFVLAREERDALTGWPAKAAPLMAAELGIDQTMLSVTLDKYLRQFLAERAKFRRSG